MRDIRNVVLYSDTRWSCPVSVNGWFPDKRLLVQPLSLGSFRFLLVQDRIVPNCQCKRVWRSLPLLALHA